MRKPTLEPLFGGTQPPPPASSAEEPERQHTREPSASPVRERLAVDERRLRLLRLGKELFATYDYDELSVGDIARRAKISRGLLYHYFPSKRDFYVQVFRSGTAELLDKMNRTTHTSLDERLAFGLSAYLEHIEHNAKLFAPTHSRLGSDPGILSVISATRRALLMGLLTALPTRSRHTRTALRGWIGFVEGAVSDWLEHGDVTRAELHRLLVEMARQTLLAPSARIDCAIAS